MDISVSIGTINGIATIISRQKKIMKYHGILQVLAGIASGGIKVVEGAFSLGAELIDLGFDTNSAANVEMFFDKLNPF